jgi:predicted SAM-dependent methyltransferase
VTAVKLNVGAGRETIVGFTSVDLHVQADLQADMGSLPHADGTVDEIYCCHALEHVGWHQVPAVLREWHRVLRPGGLLRVIVPSLDFCCAVWLHGSDRDYARQIMFGNQEHEGEYHKTGWKPEHLRADLEAAGFRDVTVAVRLTLEYSQESIIAEATR